MKNHSIIALLLMLLLAMNECLFAQQENSDRIAITGKLLDSISKKPVVYATISFSNGDGKDIAATYSEESGSFKTTITDAGKYSAEISSVGFAIKSIVFTIQAGQKQVKLDTILLAAAPNYLKDVVVTGRKKLIEQKPGMLLYNAENDLTNKGGSAADVLRKAPVLNVDAQGNVTMRGSGNIKILVNGKYSGQMARSAADALNMIPAEQIKSVEIITTPSAKYDAEGAAGVINIITKKGRKNTSGTLEASVSNWEQMLNPRFSSTQSKWNINLQGHLHRLSSKTVANLNRQSFENDMPSVALSQEITKKNAAPHGSADMVIEYAPDSSSEFSLGVTTWFGNWPDNNNLTSKISLPDGSILEQYNQAVTTKAAYWGGDINIGYTRKFKQPGKEITLLAQMSPSKDNSNYVSIQNNAVGVLLYKELNNSYTRNREWTFQADYVQPLFRKGNYILETGVKVITRNVGNDYAVEASSDAQPGILEPQAGRSDYFKYKQYVYAGYTLLKITLRHNWYIEAGTRLEKTYLEGNFKTSGTGFDNGFTNFVPTATVSKTLADGQTISVSYTKRLTRPYIWDLNPNANTSDPKNVVVGNPALQPEIAHQAEISYGLTATSGFFINAAIFWKQTNNAIIDFTETNAEGISTSNKQNLAANRQYGLNLSSSYAVTSKWNLNGNLNINRLDFNSSALQIVKEGWGADFNFNTTYKLPNKFALQAFGEYNTRTVTLQGYETYRFYYSAAVKKEFSKTKINLTLSVVNPFTNYIRQSVIMSTASFYSNATNRYYNRAVKLTANWEFGGMFQNKERKKISNDDVKGSGKG